LALVGNCAKENELWLVMKALGSRPDTSQVGAIFDAANIAIADCLYADDFATRTVDSRQSCNLTARETRKSYAKCVFAKSGYAFL